MLRKNVHPEWFKGESIEFERSLKATDTQLKIVVDYLKDKIEGSRTTKDQERELRLLIGNLLEAYKQGRILQCYIGNQNKARRTAKNKLKECRLIEYYPGSNFESGDAYTSKMMPRPLFYDLFHPLIRVTHVIDQGKDRKPKEIKRRGEDAVMMDRIFAYNEFMGDHEVSDGSGVRLKTDLHRCYKKVNGKTYKHRFHQHDYQSMKGKDRSRITIDGEEIVRLDVKACHPQILYHLNKIQLPHDPYVAFPEHPEMREVCKCAMLMIINNGSRKSAIGAFNKELRDDSARFLESIHCMDENGIRTGDVFDAVEKHNHPIRDHFYTSACHRSMDIEANILFKTMELLIRDESIPSIQVYDELIVPASREQDALETFEKVWMAVLKFKPWSTIKRLKKTASEPKVSYLQLHVA